LAFFFLVDFLFSSLTTPKIDSAWEGRGDLALFVNKINNLTTQSWKNILAFAS
jgi:hypothetical protein